MMAMSDTKVHIHITPTIISCAKKSRVLDFDEPFIFPEISHPNGHSPFSLFDGKVFPFFYDKCFHFYPFFKLLFSLICCLNSWMISVSVLMVLLWVSIVPRAFRRAVAMSSTAPPPTPPTTLPVPFTFGE